jgi:hypothetical protein
MKNRKKIGRPKQALPMEPKSAQKLIRRMDLNFVWLMFGPRLAAEEWMRRSKEWCKENNRIYVRKQALEAAAKYYRVDEDELDNWLRRSKHRRTPL